MSVSNNTAEAPVLSNAGVHANRTASFRQAVPQATTGYVPSAVTVPALPPRPEFSTQSYAPQPLSYGGMGSYGMGGMGSYGMGGMGSYGMGGMAMGGYGGMGYGGHSGGYGVGGMGMASQNPYAYGNIESRFVQMAEENTRPAFESIQSLVYAVGGVSMMLENTFFALTSSFRAILGVAENFGRLRSLFAQFWTTFGMIKSINWLIRKLSVMIGIRTEAEFKAWAEAVAATQAGTATPQQKARGSSWPVLLFFGLIAAAPYILLKMMNGLTDPTESLNEPKTWKHPLRAVTQYPFQGATPQELSFNQNQMLKIAPQALQGYLWNSGWLVATADDVSAGLVPLNHIKILVPDKKVKPEPAPVQQQCPKPEVNQPEQVLNNPEEVPVVNQTEPQPDCA